MGEIRGFVFSSVLLIGLSLSFASLASANSASTLSPSRALVPYASKCPALFISAPQQKATRTYSVPTGFYDSSGTPIMKDIPADKAESDPSSWLAIADSTPVYNDTAIKSLLESEQKIHAEVRAVYERMMKRGQNRFLVLPKSVNALDHLYQTMPNFKEAIDTIKKSLAVSLASGEPVHIPNIILLGDPGLGKTRFAKAVAEALDTSFEFVSMNNVTGGWILSGADMNWKGARMGIVGRTLVDKDYANPVIVVDEIDKARTSESQDPLASLYQLWEKRTAKEWTDEFTGNEIKIDASHINWIATANDVSRIPKPIRDRAKVIEIPKPTKEQMRAIIPSIMADKLAEHPKLKFLSTITEGVFQRLYSYSPRQVDKLIDDAIGNAVMNGRHEIAPEDINVKVLDEVDKKRGIGFLAEF